MTRQKMLKASRSARQPDRAHDVPALRFSPTAWAKLLFLRDLDDSEVGGFAITAADDLLYVQDVQLVSQVCTRASVVFEDQAVADFFDRQVDLGRKPEQFARIWVHTHPGNSPQPSMTDHETFARVFGSTNWAVMFILARQGQCYARLRFHVGPGGDLDLPVQADYGRPFTASDHAAWHEEFQANVQIAEPPVLVQRRGLFSPNETDPIDLWDDDWLLDWDRFDSDTGFVEKKEPCHVA
jgi:hypothetical protein